jgi:hypothetical protein
MRIFSVSSSTKSGEVIAHNMKFLSAISSFDDNHFVAVVELEVSPIGASYDFVIDSDGDAKLAFIASGEKFADGDVTVKFGWFVIDFEYHD